MFTAIVVLIRALFMGYHLIRCGTLAMMMTAAVVSWLTPHKIGPVKLFQTLDNGSRLVLQLVAFCVTAGIILLSRYAQPDSYHDFDIVRICLVATG